MIRIEHSVEINRPVDEVFDYMTKPENTPQWQTGMLESERISEGPVRVGTTFTEVRQMMGRKMLQKMEVMEYKPNQKWSFKSIEAPVPHEAHLVFEAIGDDTRVSLTSLGKPTGLFRLLSPLIRRQLKGQFEADFENLKQLLESNG